MAHAQPDGLGSAGRADQIVEVRLVAAPLWPGSRCDDGQAGRAAPVKAGLQGEVGTGTGRVVITQQDIQPVRLRPCLLAQCAEADGGLISGRGPRREARLAALCIRQ